MEQFSEAYRHLTSPSKRAREMRAAAIEARLTQAKGKGATEPAVSGSQLYFTDKKPDTQPDSDGSSTETDEGNDVLQETDAERLRLIESSADKTSIKWDVG